MLEFCTQQGFMLSPQHSSQCRENQKGTYDDVQTSESYKHCFPVEAMTVIESYIAYDSAPASHTQSHWPEVFWCSAIWLQY